MLSLLINHAPVLWQAFWLTCQLSFGATVLGFLLSLPLVACNRVAVLAPIAAAYRLFFRGTPLLVQLFLAYYGLAQFDAVRNGWLWQGFLSNPFWCALLVFSLNASAYMAEILLGAIRTIPKGLIEAAAAVGMSRWQTAVRVVYPQAFTLSIPAYGNEMVLLVKASALASTITLMDLMGVTKTLIAETYQAVPLLFMAGVAYFLLNMLIQQGFLVLEKRVGLRV
jgi:putative lysine/arginine/ornithine/histidine/octopine transport system permease protein